MTEKQFLPASIVDETAYFMEQAVDISITGGWILNFEGNVDSRILAKALDVTLNHYPKFKCTLVKDYPSPKRWFRYCWAYHEHITSNDILDEIEDTETNHDKDVLSYYRRFHPSHQIDVTRQVPLKVLLIRQPKHAVIIVFFHHSVSDGFGCYLFIKKFIRFYEEKFFHQKTADDASPDLTSISQPKITAPWRNVSFRECCSFLRKKTLMQRESAVQVHTPGGEGSWGTSMAVAREIPPLQFKQLRTTAKKYRVTLNDYLLSAMFQTMNQWNELHGGKRGRFYINVPVNLRSPGDLTIGNIFCGFDISATSDTIDNKRKLLTQIQEERTSMWNNNVANTTLHVTWFLKPLPLKLKDFMFKHHTPAFYPSLCLSNLGVCEPNPSHKDDEGFHYMGQAKIRSIFTINSAIPWPQVVIVTYNGKMTVSLAVFHSHFSLESAEKLLDSFVKRLME